VSTVPPYLGVVALHVIQTGHAVLAADSVEKPIQDGHTHARPTAGGGRHIAGPLIRLRVVALDRVEVALSVVAAHRVQQIVEDGHAHAATSFRHRTHHLPLARLRIVAFDAGDSVAAAPAAHGEQHLAFADGFAWARTRPLHKGPLLRQQQVVFRLVDEIAARLVGFNEDVRADGAHEEFGREQRHAHVLQHVGEVSAPLSHVVFDPGHHGLEDLFFAPHIQLV